MLSDNIFGSIICRIIITIHQNITSEAADKYSPDNALTIAIGIYTVPGPSIGNKSDTAAKKAKTNL